MFFAAPVQLFPLPGCLALKPKKIVKKTKKKIQLKKQNYFLNKNLTYLKQLMIESWEYISMSMLYQLFNYVFNLNEELEKKICTTSLCRILRCTMSHQFLISSIT